MLGTRSAGRLARGVAPDRHLLAAGAGQRRDGGGQVVPGEQVLWRREPRQPLVVEQRVEHQLGDAVPVDPTLALLIIDTYIRFPAPAG